MPSNVAVSCLLAVTCWFGASSAHAQGSALDLDVRSENQAETCLRSELLRARVAHYSSRSVAPRGLRLVLYVQSADAAELQVVRNGEVVSRRRFEQLPAACADRRDAVALSIALALERAAEARAAAGSSENTATAGSGAASSANEAAGERERQTQAVQVPAEPGTQPGDKAQGADKSQGADKARAADKAQAGDKLQADKAQSADRPQAADKAQGADKPRPASEPETPIVLGTMPSSISHVSSRDRDGASALQFHLGGRLTLEAVPMPVWVGALGIELPLSRTVTLDISALASTIGESALAGAHARASFLGLEALGCAGTPLSIFMLQVCGGATVGLCTVNGAGYFRERPEATLLWAAGLARVMLRWPQRELFALRLLVQPHLSISRPELQVERSSAHLRTQWLGVSAGLELWLALP